MATHYTPPATAPGSMHAGVHPVHNCAGCSALAAGPAKADAMRAYRRQSLTVHAVLALTTAGLGNLVYAWWIRMANKYRR